jgi:hypothetical protein
MCALLSALCWLELTCQYQSITQLYNTTSVELIMWCKPILCTTSVTYSILICNKSKHIVLYRFLKSICMWICCQLAVNLVVDTFLKRGLVVAATGRAYERLLSECLSLPCLLISGRTKTQPTRLTFNKTQSIRCIHSYITWSIIS